ncbi:hypothetical protein COOONC_21640 [Cooperia oncophora]
MSSTNMRFGVVARENDEKNPPPQPLSPPTPLVDHPIVSPHHLHILVYYVSSSTASTCFYLPNINLKGGTYDEFDASDITQCCIQCASQPCCAGYTYSKALKRCFMKSSINYSEQEDMMISGIRANANGGVGAKMKNVKIEGSGGSRITLENSDECQQYCTAVKIILNR